LNPVNLTDSEGEFLVRIARQAIETYLKENRRITPPENSDNKLREKRGVFVTLNKMKGDSKDLRGCIGFPTPEVPLIEGVIDAAVSSAFEDPRFEPVSPDEIAHLTVEVSVLTPPEIMKVSSPKEYPSKIQVGSDGLIIRWQMGSGLLLPQVPREYGWDAEEFLCHACMKAGGPPDLWLIPHTKIYTFQAEVFEETVPNGKIIRKELI